MASRLRAGRGARAGAHPESGQTTAELALLVPVFVFFVLLLVQIGLVVRDHVLVVNAAREAAREAAVDAGHGRVEGAARDVLGGVDVDVDRGSRVGDRVVVVARYASPTDVPLVGGVLPDVELRARVVTRRER